MSKALELCTRQLKMLFEVAERFSPIGVEINQEQKALKERKENKRLLRALKQVFFI